MSSLKSCDKCGKSSAGNADDWTALSMRGGVLRNLPEFRYSGISWDFCPDCGGGVVNSVLKIGPKPAGHGE